MPRHTSRFPLNDFGEWLAGAGASPGTIAQYASRIRSVLVTFDCETEEDAAKLTTADLQVYAANNLAMATRAATVSAWNAFGQYLVVRKQVAVAPMTAHRMRLHVGTPAAELPSLPGSVESALWSVMARTPPLTASVVAGLCWGDVQWEPPRADRANALNVRITLRPGESFVVPRPVAPWEVLRAWARDPEPTCPLVVAAQDSREPLPLAAIHALVGRGRRDMIPRFIDRSAAPSSPIAVIGPPPTRQ